MKSSLLILAASFLLIQPTLSQYQVAAPRYRYEFPRDHFNHEAFQTEWWYYTGNLKSTDGQRYGFELTFFRQGVDRDSSKNKAWDVQDLFLAHLALSDLDGQHFYHDERLNRSGPGIAGISEKTNRIWNGNWQIQWSGDNQQLSASNEQFKLNFAMHSEKLPVIHGENGVSQKAAGSGHASHYISLTRLATTGSIELSGKKVEVAGTSWMDHEFFTNQLDAQQSGWDWLSLQMQDNTELMLYHFRRKDGSSHSFSAGTFIDSNGTKTSLKSTDFVLTPAGKTWSSPDTHATYPIEWKITIPRLGINLKASTLLQNQELTGKTKISPSYWEGSIQLEGTRNDSVYKGLGYLEMTGYDQPFKLPE
jgi:predicted secreted hydrolase